MSNNSNLVCEHIKSDGSGGSVYYFQNIEEIEDCKFPKVQEYIIDTKRGVVKKIQCYETMNITCKTLSVPEIQEFINQHDLTTKYELKAQ